MADVERMKVLVAAVDSFHTSHKFLTVKEALSSTATLPSSNDVAFLTERDDSACRLDNLLVGAVYFLTAVEHLRVVVAPVASFLVG